MVGASSRWRCQSFVGDVRHHHVSLGVPAQGWRCGCENRNQACDYETPFSVHEDAARDLREQRRRQSAMYGGELPDAASESPNRIVTVQSTESDEMSRAFTESCERSSETAPISCALVAALLLLVG